MSWGDFDNVETFQYLNLVEKKNLLNIKTSSYYITENSITLIAQLCENLLLVWQ